MIQRLPLFALRLGIVAGTAALLWMGIAHAAPTAPVPRPLPPPRYSAQADMPMPPPASAVLSDYRLGPSDKVRVTVFGQDDLSGEYQIDGSGYVRMPLIGQIAAAGQTAPALEASIEGMLASGYLNDPKVSVEVTAYRPFYIIGQVSRPGEYPYVSNMTALNAIALAGGYTQQAVESVLYVRHEGSTVEEKLPADQSTRILPGDVVRVDTTLFWSAMNLLSPFTGVAEAAATRIP